MAPRANASRVRHLPGTDRIIGEQEIVYLGFDGGQSGAVDGPVVGEVEAEALRLDQ